MARVLLLLASFLAISAVGLAAGRPKNVTYDGRSLIIDGDRQLLFSGSIHYPRSPPEMWPELIQKAKDGGLNVIETYVFWNAHEPIQGQFNFSGNLDLVKFLRLIDESGMYVILRLGPYIEAEWNFGGFPYWLREVPDIIFRSYNEPFMYHMKKYTEMIVRMMEQEKLFAPQGGPIIMAQIENEYHNVQLAYRENGKKYIAWAADMANQLYSGVPWIMCKQKKAPANVISTCNGRYCGDTFIGPGPGKPTLWTENWTAQYRTFGDPPSQRAAEDIAYTVAHFFARNGTMNNYYMYYGGTNYGRTSSSFVTPRYYDEAPLDEYGLKREPKFGHLKHLHRALKLSRKGLFWGAPVVEKIGLNLEIYTFENLELNFCAAFLKNNHSKEAFTVNFRGVNYEVPAKSVSILPDCKTVVYNSQLVVSQHNARNLVQSLIASNLRWEMLTEKVPAPEDLPVKNDVPLELYTFAKDTSDYVWYSTSIYVDRRDLPMREDIKPVLQIASMGHALAAFVNGEFAGFEHGNNVDKNFVFQKPITLRPGRNDITILGMTVGLPNSGAYMEKRFAGPRGITLQGLMSGTLDLTSNYWSHAVGVSGEKLGFFNEEGVARVQWVPAFKDKAVTWYKTTFDEPEGTDPVALNMDSMSKGMIWVNGKSLGRYWSSFKSPLGMPTQSEYHVPRAFLKPKNNLLVVFEEVGGNPDGIQVQTVNRDTICSVISESHPPSVESWEAQDNQLRTLYPVVQSGSRLTCPEGKFIRAIEFANFGDADGACGNFYQGKCSATNVQKVVEEFCLGKDNCFVPFDQGLFGGLNGECNVKKYLTVQAKCGI